MTQRTRRENKSAVVQPSVQHIENVGPAPQFENNWWTSNLIMYVSWLWENTRVPHTCWENVQTSCQKSGRWFHKLNLSSCCKALALNTSVLVWLKMKALKFSLKSKVGLWLEMLEEHEDRWTVMVFDVNNSKHVWKETYMSSSCYSENNKVPMGKKKPDDVCLTKALNMNNSEYMSYTQLPV